MGCSHTKAGEQNTMDLYTNVENGAQDYDDKASITEERISTLARLSIDTTKIQAGYRLIMDNILESLSADVSLKGFHIERMVVPPNELHLHSIF